MQWIDRREKEPNDDLKRILVYSIHGLIHVVHAKPSGWYMADCEFDDGTEHTENYVKFKYWIPLPLPPKEINEKPS